LPGEAQVFTFYQYLRIISTPASPPDWPKCLPNLGGCRHSILLPQWLPWGGVFARWKRKTKTL